MDDVFTLLKLQVEWGADEAIEAAPIDRFRPGEARPATAARATAAAPPPVKLPQGTPVERALAAAGQATTIAALCAALAAFDGCALRDTASNLVFAEGDPASTTLLIGEPPGRDEDRGGHPFAGAEGSLLDQMLASIGLQRAELMLTPLLPWRPPGGRPVNAAELALCLPFLHRLIALSRPRRILLFGGTAARALLPPTARRRRNPPTWLDVNIPGLSETRPTLILPSLAEMLKNPLLRRDAWAGLRLLRRHLDQADPGM